MVVGSAVGSAAVGNSVAALKYTVRRTCGNNLPVYRQHMATNNSLTYTCVRKVSGDLRQLALDLKYVTHSSVEIGKTIVRVQGDHYTKVKQFLTEIGL